MALPTHNRSATEPITRNVSFRGTPKHLPLQSTTETSTVIDQPLLSGVSDESSPGGALSEDTRWGAAWDDTVIPSSHPFRTLVICYDGTGDQFDDDNSNIVQLFSMLKKDDRNQQMVYYQAGIGTYTIPQIATPAYAKFSKLMDMAIAQNLDAHVMGGYEFLMEHYQAEDKICIFGFSRGAYTARALAGMIHKVGLLPASNKQQVPFAYKMFTREDEEGWKQSNLFKKTFSVDVEIEFLGVWDTVASVGLIPRHLPFTTSNSAIRYFRHAISLDEHRAKFKANHFKRNPPHIHALGIQPGQMPRSNQKPRVPQSQSEDGGAETHHPHSHAGHKVGSRHLERDYDQPIVETDVLEVWFAGCHTDVGGGSVRNGTRHALARIPLRWMIRECFRCNTGIQFHRDSFKFIGMDPSNLYPFVRPRPPPLSVSTLTPSDQVNINQDVQEFDKSGTWGTLTEEEEDLRDSLCPIYDQLVQAKAWWILEFLPLKIKSSQPNRSWMDTLRVNRGRPREIPKHERGVINWHRTVRTRMNADKVQMISGNPEKYKPRPEMDVEPKWVD